MRNALLALLLAATPALATPTDDLRQVVDDHWAWYLRTNPVLATSLGERRYDREIGDFSLAAQDQQASDAQGFLARLKALPDAGLSPADRTSNAILARLLAEQVEGNRYPERELLFTSYGSWWQGFASMADNLPFKTAADYASYLDRLAQYPKVNQTAIAISRDAVKQGMAQPCSALGGTEKSISGLIVADPAQSRFYEPLTRARPLDMDAAAWSAAQAKAKAIIRDVIDPQNRALLLFYMRDYAPACRKTDGASAMPQGAAWYAYQARVMTTTTLSPAEIHALGLKEVARIGAEMDALAKTAGYADRAAFVAKLHSDPKYYATTPKEMLAAAAFQAKTIDGKLPGYFGKLPRLPYGIRPIPAETAEGTTTAYYGPGSPEAGIAGTYWVNTSKLDQRPLWELPALTAHEAVPGHHNQIALQQELDLPEFRKNEASFTAFVEGWALYSEHLGIEMGLYDTPEKNMGRLSYEMWRACRLVVDTGIHSMGWTKTQAVAFMRVNTALTDANIDAEVNRYISWPGQALAYKLGELRIRALRAKAEAALGPKFDLRGFHDAVLGQGAVPLDILDAQIDAWIAAQQAKG